MKIIDPKEVATSEFHGYLLGSVAPRPIAFVSTIDAQGQINLSPYSFFNAFGTNPPTLIFSPSRRVRDNTIKHSLENVREVREVVVNIVSYEMVQQMSLSSTEYPKNVNEFTKSGFTEAPSQKVQPPRVAEAKAAFECKVVQIIETGQEGGAGNLVICEVILAHIDESILDEHNKVDPFRLDAVGRMGGNWYCRAQGEALFEVAKPLRKLGIGVDQIPDSIRLSKILTGNDLGKLGNVEQLPKPEEIEAHRQETEIKSLLETSADNLENKLHLLAQKYLDQDEIHKAWSTLLIATNNA